MMALRLSTAHYSAARMHSFAPRYGRITLYAGVSMIFVFYTASTVGTLLTNRFDWNSIKHIGSIIIVFVTGIHFATTLYRLRLLVLKSNESVKFVASDKANTGSGQEGKENIAPSKRASHRLARRIECKNSNKPSRDPSPSPRPSKLIRGSIRITSQLGTPETTSGGEQRLEPGDEQNKAKVKMQRLVIETTQQVSQGVRQIATTNQETPSTAKLLTMSILALIITIIIIPVLIIFILVQMSEEKSYSEVLNEEAKQYTALDDVALWILTLVFVSMSIGNSGSVFKPLFECCVSTCCHHGREG